MKEDKGKWIERLYRPVGEEKHDIPYLNEMVADVAGKACKKAYIRGIWHATILSNVIWILISIFCG